MPELELFRGDAKTVQVKVSTVYWTTGGKLFFAAKPGVDDDNADTTAVIKKTLTDGDIIASDTSYKTYNLALEASDTNGITPGDYTGEFQYVDASGNPNTSEQFTIRIVGDINRRVS